MIENDLKEKNFEAAIEQWLVAEGIKIPMTKSGPSTCPRSLASSTRRSIRSGNCSAASMGRMLKADCTTTFRMQYRDMALSMSCVMASMTLAST